LRVEGKTLRAKPLGRVIIFIAFLGNGVTDPDEVFGADHRISRLPAYPKLLATAVAIATPGGKIRAETDPSVPCGEVGKITEAAV